MIRDKGIYMKFLKPLLVFVLICWTNAVQAQDANKDSLRSLRMTSASGNWLSGGINTGFVSVGQQAASTLLTVTDGQTELRGSLGFLVPLLAEIEPNNPPVAIVPEVTVFYEVGDILILEGFDPDGDEISFEVTGQPVFGDLLTGGADGRLFSFLPSSTLTPGLDYSDTVFFKVNEINSDLFSEVAAYPFTFRVEDKAHNITTFEQLSSDAVNKTFSLSFTDEQFNASYDISITYIDLTDPLNPKLDTLSIDTYNLDDLAISGNVLTASVSVLQTKFPFLFSADKVFISVDVITGTGFSDNEAFILENPTDGSTSEENTAGGGVSVATGDDITVLTVDGSSSEDGLFFTFASERSTPENTDVELNLYAIELGGFDLTNATIDLSKIFTNGTASSPILVKNTANLIQWVLTYTPSGDVGYLDEMEFTVDHTNRDFSAKSMAKVNVIGVNDPPTLTAVPNQQVNEEGTLIVDLEFADVDNELIVSASSSDSPNLPLVLNGKQLTISSVSDFNGLVNVTVLVKEDGTTESYNKFVTFEVEVIAVNDRPVMGLIANQSVDEDNVFTYSLTATDVDARVPIFTYEVTPNIQGVSTVEIVGNQLTITPNANYNGLVSFEVTADDRIGSSTSVSSVESFDLVINPINDAPEISKPIPTQNVVEGFPTYTIDLGQFFEDVETADKDLEFTLGAISSLFTLSIVDNQLSITALDGQSGNENIIITASDGEKSVAQPIDLVLEAQNADIQIISQIPDQALMEDFAPHSIDLSNVFTDVNDANAVFTFTTTGLNNLSGSIDNGNTLVINSLKDFNGTEEVYLVGTSNGKSSFISFEIIVSKVNDAPLIASIENQSIQEDVALKNVYSQFSDIDNEDSELEFTVVSSNQSLIKDASVSITIGSGGVTLAASPELNQHGTSTLSLTVSDGNLTATSTFDVVVTSVNDAPVVVSASISDATEDQSFEVDLSSLFSDIDGDALTYTIENKPEWLTQAGNVLSGTPVNNQVGENPFHVTADDGNGGSVRQQYSIMVINTNDAPNVSVPAADISISEDVLLSSAVGSSVFTDVDGDVLTLSVSFSNAKWLTFDATSNRFAGTPGNDDVGNIDITITATDPSGATVTDQIVITVLNTNDNPTEIEVTSLEIVENSSLSAVVGIFSTVDVDAGDSHTYKLVGGTGDSDNASFEISTAELITNDNLNFETKASYSIRVQTIDVSGATYEKALTVTVIDENEAPTALTISEGIVPENVDIGTRVGDILVTDEDAGDSHTYAFITGSGDVDNDLFEISEGKLLTKTALNFESKSTYSIRLKAVDVGGFGLEKEITISVSDENDAPTDISLSADTIIENSDPNTSVGTFTTTDEDVSDTYTISLVSGDGDTDNDKFDIDGADLIALDAFDYETSKSYSIRVRSTDVGGAEFEKLFIITVENEVEASIAGIDNLNFSDTEEGGSSSLSFTIENTGELEIVVTNITAPPGFNIANTSFTVVLGGEVDVEVVFRPTMAKTYSGDIVITSTLGETTIGVTGIGTIVTGIEDGVIHNSDWKIYPNPAKNIIIIDLSDISHLKPSVGIVSVNGAEMWQMNSIEEKQLEVNVGSYPEGTYLVRIISTKGTVVKKLLIVR